MKRGEEKKERVKSPFKKGRLQIRKLSHFVEKAI